MRPHKFLHKKKNNCSMTSGSPQMNYVQILSSRLFKSFLLMNLSFKSFEHCSLPCSRGMLLKGICFIWTQCLKWAIITEEKNPCYFKSLSFAIYMPHTGHNDTISKHSAGYCETFPVYKIRNSILPLLLLHWKTSKGVLSKEPRVK